MENAGFIGILVLLVLMLTRMPIGFIMALTGFFGIWYVRDVDGAIGILKTVPFSTVASYNLSVVPLFILMGEFAFQAGLTENLYRAVHRWLGHQPGGLSMATIMGCGIFSAISGSSPATAGAMGRVALPEMAKYRYDMKLATASVVAGGSLGNLIPPGVGIVIYGVLTEQSIGKLIVACVIPGVVLMLMYMITAYIIARRHPEQAPRGPGHSWRERFIALKSVVGIGVIFLISMGGIYVGVFTATEAAAVGAFLSFLYALGSGNLTWPKFAHCLVETGRVTALVFTILIGAMIFGYFLSMARLPMAAADLISSLEVSKYVVLVGIMIIYLILGCFMDSLAMILLTVPIFFPVIVKLGFDPIWFGVLVVTAMEEGLITPPVGMNLYIVKGIAPPEVKLTDIFQGVLPFVLTILGFQVVLILLPETATWLPGTMK